MRSTSRSMGRCTSKNATNRSSIHGDEVKALATFFRAFPLSLFLQWTKFFGQRANSSIAHAGSIATSTAAIRQILPTRPGCVGCSRRSPASQNFLNTTHARVRRDTSRLTTCAPTATAGSQLPVAVFRQRRRPQQYSHYALCERVPPQPPRSLRTTRARPSHAVSGLRPSHRARHRSGLCSIRWEGPTVVSPRSSEDRQADRQCRSTSILVSPQRKHRENINITSSSHGSFNDPSAGFFGQRIVFDYTLTLCVLSATEQSMPLLVKAPATLNSARRAWPPLSIPPSRDSTANRDSNANRNSNATRKSRRRKRDTGNE
jgi:hypothetical protein